MMTTTVKTSFNKGSRVVRIEKKLRQLNLSALGPVRKNSSADLAGSDDGSITTGDSSVEDSSRILTQEITLTSKEPLKILEMLEVSFNCGNLDTTLIREVCKYLKLNGKALDKGHYQEYMNHYFKTLRNLSRDTGLDNITRTQILEMIELRASKWECTEEQAKFYSAKTNQSEVTHTGNNSNNNHQLTATKVEPHQPSPGPCDLSTSISSPALCANLSSSALSPVSSSLSGSSIPATPGVSISLSNNEVIKHSVMGIKGRRVHLIEELSDTVISFQRVSPGAKDRLLQITGPDESSINKAKYYIEDTIKRNASPMPSETPASLIQPIQPATKSSPNINHLVSTSFSNLNTSSSSSTVDASLLSNQGTEKVSKTVAAIETSASTLVTASKQPSGVTASNLPYVQAVYIGNELLIVSSSTSSLAIEAKNVLETYFKRNGKRRSTIGSREPSESSDSEASIHRYGEMKGTSNNELWSKSHGNHSVGDIKSEKNRSSVPPSSDKSTRDINASSNNNKIQKSASHGSISTGRTSLRFLRKEFEVDSDLIESPEMIKTPRNQKMIAYDRDFLIQCGKSQVCKTLPDAMKIIIQEIPDIARKIRKSPSKNNNNPDDLEWP